MDYSANCHILCLSKSIFLAATDPEGNGLPPSCANIGNKMAMTAVQMSF